MSQINMPNHIAIIMDGNGRWAKRRHMPRFTGHKAGLDAVRNVVKFCVTENVKELTLFAFSSENWRRPEEEVSLLMNLFMNALDREVKKLHANGVRLKIIGEKSTFPESLQERIVKAEQLTLNNDRLHLNIAANYGGRWDITQSCRQLAQKVAQGELLPTDITQDMLADHLSLAGSSEPDLFIRTGGEMRISNFLLWQLAYTEFYFTDLLWPEFDESALKSAIVSFNQRERRFGQTSEQVQSSRA